MFIIRSYGGLAFEKRITALTYREKYMIPEFPPARTEFEVLFRLA